MSNIITAQTILDQIKASRDENGNTGIHLMMCWGYRNAQVLENGVQFHVSGLKFKGVVQVRLNGMDLYDIQFWTIRRNLKKEYADIYCDQLLELIDGYVER